MDQGTGACGGGDSVKRPYYLKKRGDFWYYRLNSESGLTAGEDLNYHTTECCTRPEAKAFMADMLWERPEKHMLKDPFAAKHLSEITRADIFDLRSRLLKRYSPATANKVINVVKVVLREAVIREKLRRDPTELVHRVRHQKGERGVFTAEKL
jgi:hypothetical protein